MEPNYLDLSTKIDPETDPQETATLKQLAEECLGRFHQLTRNEKAGVEDGKEADFWASRQLAEFNLWCTKVGVYSEGQRSIDIRLKDVPEICTLLMQILQSIHRDLNDLCGERSHQTGATSPNAIDPQSDISDSESEARALEYDSLSSSEGSEDPDASKSAEEIRTRTLRSHVGDSIDRLQAQARRIERAGAQHRRKRVEVYRQKEGPKQVYDGLKKLGMCKANQEYTLASDIIKERMAESFARRRTRFDYLKQHQKKRILEISQLVITSPESDSRNKKGDEAQITMKEKTAQKNPTRGHTQAGAQSNLLSATLNTKYDLRPEQKKRERAESVRSIALRHPGFPPPPQTADGKFHCPYCLLQFDAREAEKGPWSEHVMYDFEPYFCTFEACNTPFEIPNSFDGLLDHMHTHVPVLHHIDEHDGDHKEFLDTEFEEHMKRHDDVTDDLISSMKETSRMKGAHLFESCPFCGGYPDVLEKRFPDSETLDAQIALREHIRKHMEDIALFLPPYRSDIFQEDNAEESQVTNRQTIEGGISYDPADHVTLCGRESCDCSTVDGSFPSGHPDEPEFDTEWSDLFDSTTSYHRSETSSKELVNDKRLLPFIWKFIAQEYKFLQLPLVQFRDDWTALACAIANRQEKLARILIHLGADLTSRDRDGFSPLAIAIIQLDGRSLDCSFVNHLIEKGADIEARDHDNNTPLYLAVEENQSLCVQLLLDKGADVNARCSNGTTPLCLAASEPLPPIVGRLMNSNADHRLKDNHGRTPIFLAAMEGHCAVLEQILAALNHHERMQEASFVLPNSDVSVVDNYGRSPLSWAALQGFDDIVELLLVSGADIQHKDKDGYSPLALAAMKGHHEIVRMLLTNDSRYATGDMGKAMALYLATLHGREAVLTELLKFGTFHNYCDELGRMPLHIAAWKGNSTIVRLLLQFGADPNAPSAQRNKTPLHFAAEFGNTSAAELLLEAGANTTLVDANGMTALVISIRRNDEELVQLLSKSPEEPGSLPILGIAEEERTKFSPGKPPPFLFKIDEIGERVEALTCFDSHGNWKPSTDAGANHYVGGGVSGKVWLCDGNRIYEISSTILDGWYYKKYSVYFSGGKGFWILAGDATSPPDNEHWHPLRFDHHPTDQSSVLSIAGQHSTLQVQRRDQMWAKLLLPDIYHTSSRTNRQDHGGLTGELPIFLALIALSTSKDYLATVLKTSFWIRQWRVHRYARPRSHQRGIVVTVYTAPSNLAGGSTAADLDSYERGQFGKYFS